MTKRKAVLFDWDGVFVASFAILVRVLQKRCPAIIEDQVREMFEGNITTTMLQSKYHTAACVHDINLLEMYNPLVAKLDILPAMQQVVLNLAPVYRLHIVSSSVSHIIQQILIRHSILELFEQIWGHDVHNSKIEKFRMLLKAYNLLPEDCIFITDTLGDVIEAREVGIPAIGVTGGFHSRETLLKGKPLHILEKPEELVNIISQHFGGKNGKFT
jgi:phosphoglycolate phosphatase